MISPVVVTAAGTVWFSSTGSPAATSSCNSILIIVSSSIGSVVYWFSVAVNVVSFCLTLNTV